MARKTLPVRPLIDQANHLLSLPDAHGTARDLNADFRWGVISVIERILHDSGNYSGFRYLSSELVGPDEPHTPNTTYLRIGYDETRRAYVIPTTLVD